MTIAPTRVQRLVAGDQRSNRRWGSPLRAMAAAALMTVAVGYADAAPPTAIAVGDSSFKCLKDMVKVRHFYVDNLQGHREATRKVAAKGKGRYPTGSVIQLVPGEVMVKQPKGFNAATNDWEFFELDVSKEGSKIRKRGFADVVNRFGGNCFTCHVKARPEFDFVCENDHGCDPIPITRRMLAALQKTDPRCTKPDPLTDDDQHALKELDEVLKTMSAK
ncbi:MAG: hypothetical protein JSR69_14205 [Proteobacteria bacterium]|nr:hypothetical protein [Pseudomonadota bacterium]